MRGTTSRVRSVAAIEAAGAQAVLADPDRLGTLRPQLDGVTVLCWLNGGTATDAAEALHGRGSSRWCEPLVRHTRCAGCVYEAAGSVEPALFNGGTAIVRRAG